jgi:peptidoglycan LD-endopeptidase CwlK
MPSFGERSRKNLDSADPKLRQLFDEVIKVVDCSVLCGFRDEKDQETAFEHGFSKVHWPHSKHNTFPSKAVDVVPWPLDWNNTDSFEKLGTFVTHKAKEMGIEIQWGGTWEFRDLPHYQLKDA